MSANLHDIFARHGDIPASCTHGAEFFDCLRHFVFRYIKGKVAIIKAELVACFVVHFRRNTGVQPGFRVNIIIRCVL